MKTNKYIINLKNSMKKLFILLMVTITISMVLGFAFEPVKGNYNNSSVVWLNQQSLSPTPLLLSPQNITATYFTESFDGTWSGTPPTPAGWTIIHTTATGGSSGTDPIYWAKNTWSGSAWSSTGNGTPTTPTGAYDGSSVAWYNDYNAKATQKDQLTTGNIDLSGSTNPRVTFYLALNASSSLTLKLRASSDGGTSWNDIQTLTKPGVAWTKMIITLPAAYKVATTRIGIEVTATWGSYDIWVDKFVVDDVPAPLTGTKTIKSSGGDYSSFTAAINALNDAGVGAGGVTFNVDNGFTITEDCPIITATGTAANPIVFQKASSLGLNAVIKPTGTTGTTDAGIRIAGGDYITFDGIDITIASGSAVEYGYYIYNASTTNGAQNNTIKNTKITLNRTNTSSVGIYQNVATTPTNATGANSNNKYYNITVENAFSGIYLLGNATYPDLSCEIGTTGGGTTTIGASTTNDIGNGSGTLFGIRATQQQNIKIFSCEVRNVTGTGTGSNYHGIFLDGLKGTTNAIYLNNIHDIKGSSTSNGATISGIRADVASGVIVNIYNNFISGITHASTTASSIQYVRGISCNVAGGTGTVNAYYNSIRIETSQYISSTAFYSQSGTANTVNNIFSNFSATNATSKRYCSYISSGTLTTSNYNDYFINTSGTGNNVGYYSAADRNTLALWQTATSKDANSVNVDPSFISATNLHASASGIDAKGTPITIAAGFPIDVTTDIDGTTRNATTPDIGADEFTAGVDNPSGVSATAISNSQINIAFTPNVASNNVVVVWNATGTFTSPSGTPTLGGSLAGGTVLSIGTTSPVNHTSLTAGTVYYYKAFSYDGSNYSLGVTANATTFNVPTLTTTAATNVLYTTATTGGNVSSNGGSTITEYGVCYSTSANPTTADSKVFVTGAISGAFTSNLTGLSTGTLYHYRAYAINSVGTSYGSDLTFTTGSPISSFPWSENFDALPSVGNNIYPTSWYKENGDWQSASSSTNTYNDPRSMPYYIINSYGATNEYIWTPLFQLTAGVAYDFSFWFAGDGFTGWTGDVFYNSSQTLSGATQLGTSFITSSTTSTSTYTQVTRQFIPSASGTYSFALRINANSTPWYIGFDDFSVNVLAVANPTGLTATASSSSQINLEWTKNGNDNNVMLVYNTTNTFGTPSDGTNYNVGETIEGVGTVVYNGPDPSYSHTGLSANTTYYYKAFSVDGSNNYSTGVTANATTPCANVTLPLTQGFNATTIPGCWSTQFVTGTSAIQYVASSTNPTTTPQEGTHYVYWNSFSITSGNSTRLVSPPITTTGTTSVDVNFYWMHDAGYPTDADGVYVEYSTDGIIFTQVGSLISRYDATLTGWNKKTVTLPAGAGNQPTIYVGFKFYSAYGNNCSMDNLTISATPTNPVFAISPTTKNYGNVAAEGGSASQIFTITNTGQGTLTINNGDITLSGTNASEFSISNVTYPISLTNGQSAPLTVTFAPLSSGAKSGSLDIQDNIAKTLNQIPLTGTGVYNAPQSPTYSLQASTYYPILSWSAPASPFMLRGDDGNLEKFVKFDGTPGTNNIFAKRFISGSEGNLSQIAVLIKSEDVSKIASVKVFGADNFGNIDKKRIIASTNEILLNETTGWTFIKLGENVKVNKDEIFYVTLQMAEGMDFLIATDINENDGNNFASRDGGDTWLNYNANYIIRVYKNLSPNEELLSSDISSETKIYSVDYLFSSQLKKEDKLSGKEGRGSEEKISSVSLPAVTSQSGVKVLQSYSVYRSLTSNTYTTPLQTGISGTTYTDNTVSMGTTYYYVIRAQYENGESGNSTQLTIIPWNPHYGTFATQYSNMYKFSNSTADGNPGQYEKPTYEWFPTNSFTTINTWTAGTDDDGYYTLNFPGSYFKFFGTDYTSVYIGTNGYITFGAGYTEYTPNGALPQASDPFNMIAAAFQDLYVYRSNTPASKISYLILSDKIVISYENIYRRNTANYISFQIILYTQTNSPAFNSHFIINYNDLMSSTPLSTNAVVVNASVGVNGPNGTVGCNYRYNNARGPIFDLNVKGSNQLALGYNDTEGGANPVSLASFTSSVNGRNVNLKWVTAMEENNAGFEVMRSLKDAEQWTKVGFIGGKGTKNTPTEYNFADMKLNTGKYQYKLKQVDNNGNYEYYSLNGFVEIGIPAKFNLSQNYPNPFNPTTKIDFDLPADTKVSIKIYDMLGKEIKTLVNEFRTAGYYTVTFDASGMSTGTYFYRIMTEGDKFTMTKKMVIIK